MLDNWKSWCTDLDGRCLFDLDIPPSGVLSGMISIPHAGLTMPEEFRSWLTEDEEAWGQDVDFEVHELIDRKALCREGILILKANVHRVACDLNRQPSKAILNWKENSMGVPLVKSFPPPSVLEGLISSYHGPYFRLIRHILTTSDERLVKRSPSFFFIDLHSMPSEATAYHLAKNPDQKTKRPDFCLSDLGGRSCSPGYMKAMERGLLKRGRHPLVNDPYGGGYITQFVCPYVENNIQIEINRGLYMDEKNRRLTEGASLVKDQLTSLFLEATSSGTI